MCAPKLRTPGMARSSLLTAIVVRCISAADVPGCAHPVDQEVALLEGREQRLAQQRHQQQPDDGDRARNRRTPPGAGR